MSAKRKRNNYEYWYFRLTEKDVFDSDVQQIKNVPGIGYVIFVIYIELCARSVKNGGYFVINRTSPQNGYAADLARLINEDPTNTGHALSYLSAHGFVEILEGDYEVVLHIPIVDNNTGKSSLEADRVRAIDRQKRMDEKSRLLLEEKESRIENCSSYGIFKNIFLSVDEYQSLKGRIKNIDNIIDILSVYKKGERKDFVNDYKELLKYLYKTKRLSQEELDNLSPEV